MATHLSSRHEDFEYWIGVLKKKSQHIVDKQWNIWYGLHIYYLKWVDDQSLFNLIWQCCASERFERTLIMSKYLVKLSWN